MKIHKRVIVHARSSNNLALLRIVETAGEGNDVCLHELLDLAKMTIAINPRPESFLLYYEMVLAACTEIKLTGTECLTGGERNGYCYLNESPTSESGRAALKNCRSLQENMTDDLLRFSFEARLTVEPMIQIQKTLLKWLLEKALLDPIENDCLLVFGKYLFRRLEPSQEQMFIDLIREVTMLPGCSEKVIRNMFLWLGDNTNLQGKFAERVRQTVAVSWQHKLPVTSSIHLIRVFDEIINCSGHAWPTVEVFANRIRLLESEARRLIQAILEDCRGALPSRKVSFGYNFEGSMLTITIETTSGWPQREEERFVAILRSFWKKYHWNEGTHERIPVEVKIGDSLFSLDTGKRK